VGPDGVFSFDAIPETLSKTTLGLLSEGDQVHLEHAATATTLLGGHIVQGHVDGVARVVGIDTTDGWRVRLAVPSEIMVYMAPKGSVCLDGVSLTLAKVEPREGWIEVALIPTTLEKTMMGGWIAGRGVNIEADVLAKTVVQYMRAFAGRGDSHFRTGP
jgi:riboflavin synthase